MSAELKVTMTTDELVEEVRLGQQAAWRQGYIAACNDVIINAERRDLDRHTNNPYDSETQEAA